MTAAHKISVVVFDLGRVLVHIDFDAFPRSLGIDPKRARRKEKDAVEQLAMRYETGQLTTDRFFDHLGEVFEGRYTKEELLTAWNAIIGEENKPMLPIVEEVQARYETAILSNTSPVHFQKAYDNTSIIKRFSRRYLSYQMGAAKPSFAVFRRLIEDLPAAGSSILFIDDVQENVDAALKCGIVAILYDGVGKLEIALRRLEVLNGGAGNRFNT